MGNDVLVGQGSQGARWTESCAVKSLVRMPQPYMLFPL